MSQTSAKPITPRSILLSLVLLSCGCSELVGPGRWEPRASMPTSRSSFATAAVDDLVYTFGGMNSVLSPDTYLDTVEIYDPITDTWRTGPPLPRPRIGAATAIIDGGIYLAGGYTWDGETSGYLDRLDRFDTATETWTELPPMPTPRSLCTGAALDGKFYVIAGRTERGKRLVALDTVEVFDPATRTWTEKAPIPGPREAPAAVTQKDTILLAGGFEFETFGYFDELLVYDPARDHWTPAPKPLSLGRCSLAATPLWNRFVLFMGGYLEAWPPFRTEVDLFDLSTREVTPIAPLPEGRAGLGATTVRGRVFAMGGGRFDEPSHTYYYPCGEVWEFIPEYKGQSDDEWTDEKR